MSRRPQVSTHESVTAAALSRITRASRDRVPHGGSGCVSRSETDSVHGAVGVGERDPDPAGVLGQPGQLDAAVDRQVVEDLAGPAGRPVDLERPDGVGLAQPDGQGEGIAAVARPASDLSVAGVHAAALARQ